MDANQTVQSTDPIEAAKQEVLEALQSRRGDWPRIAAAADVSHSWLSKFANNRIPNPGTETLKKLRAALALPTTAVSAAPP